ncbi:MAG: sulfatase-like hydrolase/transferase, partial [Chthoniobacteraceae bacterium]|nr:sulfatase-like hydrolase/transferase [Chthoniobacteraceae bacterium]
MRKNLPYAVASLYLGLFVAPMIFAGTATKPLNILVLYADDWRYDTLGAAGHPVVKTPNLDQLAAEGVRFTHNCVTTSICGVSRASLFT